MLPLQRGRMLVELSKRNCSSNNSGPNSKRHKIADNSQTEAAETRDFENIEIDAEILRTSPNFSFTFGSDSELDISSIIASTETCDDFPSALETRDLGQHYTFTSTPRIISSHCHTPTILDLDECQNHNMAIPLHGASLPYETNQKHSSFQQDFCQSQSIQTVNPDQFQATTTRNLGIPETAMSQGIYLLQESMPLPSNPDQVQSTTTGNLDSSETALSTNINHLSESVLLNPGQPRTPTRADLDPQGTVMSEHANIMPEAPAPSAKVSAAQILSYCKTDCKEKRLKGEIYVGRHFDKESGKYTVLEKAGKLIKERCFCKSKGTQCEDVSEASRKEMFTEFWQNMKTWREKRLYIKNLVDISTNNEQPKKRNVLKYHLKVKAAKLQVCSKMFLNTFCLTDWTVRSWCSNEPCDEKRRSSHYDRASQQKKHCLEEFLGKINTLPSHYCRKSSNKMYLERHFRSMSDVHQAYKQQCLKDAVEPLSVKVFTTLFREKNMALFLPRKDQCDTCVQHEVKNIDDEFWNQHRQKCKAAQDAKSADKAVAISDDQTLVITVDLQAVLLAPSIQASALYYKTKLAVHNFTIFNLANADVDCYLWHEGEGGLTANEFSSCLYEYLTKHMSTKTRAIIYSDGCNYQNRNKTISKMMCLLSKESGKIIEQKFLEKGHTQMECDSVHATIERALKKNGRPCDIYSPIDYARIISNARKSGKPYNVHYLAHDFFKNFDNVASWTSIRPGKMSGDPYVVDIRALQYLPNGTINYKLKHGDDWKLLPHSRADKNITVDETPRSLYQTERKITDEKYNHLQQMKDVLPKDVHQFYNNLPHLLA